MSCHCEKCKDNLYECYEHFFEESNLFYHYERFSDPDLSHEERRTSWGRAHKIVAETLDSVAHSLKNGHNIIRFMHLAQSYTRKELSEWILNYVCEDCWNSQPLPHSTFFYFFSPVATDMYYAIVNSLDFVEKEPYFKKNCLDFLVSMKNRYVCRNGLVCYDFRGFDYYYENIAGFPIYLHGLTTREDYEIRKKGRLTMQIEDHPLASHGLLWEQLQEMFDEDGQYITNY
tara:strand:+ start:32621 stop:33310 length:690 start_codon:yes stop_codon:yes gene_type:complete